MGFLLVIMRFGIVPSLLVLNANMLFVLISCLFSRSELEKVQTLLYEMLILSVSVVESCSEWGSPCIVWLCAHPAAAGWWISLAWDLKNLVFSAHTSAVSCEMF